MPYSFVGVVFTRLSSNQQMTTLQYSPQLSLHRSPRICVFVFVFICVFVLEIMRLNFFLGFFFLRLLFFAFFCAFLRSHENGCRSKRISFSSVTCNMTLLFIKNQNNLLYAYSKRRSKYFFIYKIAVYNLQACI